MADLQLKSPLVITFPDFKGQDAIKLGTELLELHPDAKIVPILNGPDRTELQRVSELCVQHEGILPIIVGGKGLFAATLEAYGELVGLFTYATIVKIDTAEHPRSWIGHLALRAEVIEGFVVGDLVFGDDKLKPDTPEHHAHLHAWPNLYSVATHGKLPLSGAHGFQAFGPGVLGKAFPLAKKIGNVASDINGRPLQYGLDGIMAIACSRVGHVERAEVPGVVERNRPAEKILGQLSDHIAVARAAHMLFKS